MDSENSGAIFRLKNLALVRSPHVVPAPVTKETDSRLSSTKMKSVTSEQSAAINAIFDQIYRATPLPTTMLQNSNYNSSFWDTGLQFPPDAPGISPIYGFSHSSSSSQSGGVDQPYYERAQQLRLNHVQPIPQNQHPLTNSYAPTMIPPSNRQERIFDSSTYLQSQYHAGSHVHLHSESNDLPAENSLSNSILLKDGQNNPHESFFVMQDKKVSGDADEPTIDDIVDGDDYSTSTTGNLLLEVSNEDATAASNSSVSFAEIRNSNSASSSSKAQLPSTSTAAIGSPVDATSRPKLRRKFVMDSLFCLNMKPVTERHALSDNDSLSAEGFNDKTVKGMSFKKTAKLPSSGQKEVTGKKSAVILATNTSDYVKDNRISSQEKNDAHVDLESRGLGLTFASNSPRSKNSLSSNGKNGTTSSQSKSPSNFAAAQRHGSLILVPLAQLYSYSTASSSDDDFNNSYSKAKIKAKSAVKARIDRRKSSATKGTSRILDPEIGLDPLEPCKTDSEVCHVAIPIPSSGSVTLNQKDLGTAVSETSETEIGHSSIPLESVKTTVIAKVRASNRVKTPPSSSDSEVQTRCDPPSAGSSSLTRTTRSSVGGKIFIQSESSSGSARTGDGVRSEDGAHTESASIVRVLPSAAPTTRRTRRSVVDSDSDAPSCAAEWHQEEVLALHSAHMQVDATAPDFWDQVRVAMVDRGYRRSADVCRDEWYKFTETVNKKVTRVKKNAEIMTVDMPTSSGSTGTNEHSDLSTDVAGQKRKRRTRADIKRLAEESSEATRADDIFEYERNQRSRVFVTLAVKNGIPSTASAPSSSTALSKSVASPSRSSPRRSSPSKNVSVEGITDLQSPQAVRGTESTQPYRSNQISKRNIASYVHNLSKKTESMRCIKAVPAVPSKGRSRTKSSTKGRSRKSGQCADMAEGISAAFSPRTGRVVVTSKAVRHGSPEDCDDNDSDEYNRNMSEEEDGDF